MERKNIVATIYLKNGVAVKNPEDTEVWYDAVELATMYDDTGIDKIICFDLSDDEKEHAINLSVIKDINKNIDVKTCGGGNINSFADVRALLNAGCIEVVLNGSKPDTPELLEKAANKVGQEKLLVSLQNVNFLFKAKELLTDYVHELLIMDHSLLQNLENMTDIPYILVQDEYDIDDIKEELKSKKIRGIYGKFINDPHTDIMLLKGKLSDSGIKMDNFEPTLSWNDLKKNSDGLVPVIVQDYQTDQVLMLAYMDEEAFQTTIRIGKMTYHSRSRNELWTKGLTSGHIQYVKSLTADCDYDTILAKVSQIGGIACHTGSTSCFFNTIIKKEYTERSPLKVLEREYNNLINEMDNPKENSVVTELFEQGIDEILRRIGAESSQVIIAAKNENSDELVYEMADYIYANLKHEDVVMINGYLEYDKVILENIQILL